MILQYVLIYQSIQLGNNHVLIWGGGGGGGGAVMGYYRKKNLMPWLTENKFRFCIIAENKSMLSPARIFFMKKCISVPHDRKQILCFPSHEKKIF